MADVYAGYLCDLGTLLRERAADASTRAAAVRSDSSPAAAFAIGYWQAYSEVLSVMGQQARTFGLPLADVGLDGLDFDTGPASNSGR